MHCVLLLLLLDHLGTPRNVVKKREEMLPLLMLHASAAPMVGCRLVLLAVFAC
jgi:hypothetical protein